MKTLQIQVTDKHIDAKGRTCSTCAVSLAIQEATGYKTASIGYSTMDSCIENGKHIVGKVENVANWIYQFDDWVRGRDKRPEPITFTLIYEEKVHANP